MHIPHCSATLFLAALVYTSPAPACSTHQAAPRPTAVAERPTHRTIGPFEVTRVVDGDTVHVQREGRIEKLRLLSVDTEEKLSSGASSASKPGTVFGEETTLWARELIESFVADDGVVRVSLLLPNGVEQLDIYGRLLCHVILPDGTDFNLQLVREGKSPYFTKYGYSTVDHAAFVEAEREARARGLGIWDPSTNVPVTPGAPVAARPYERLMPWWNARAEAIEVFRRRNAAAPHAVVSAEDPEALARAIAARAEDATREITVFGEIDRLFDEDDGSKTVLFRGPDRARRVRARIPAEARAAHAALDLDGRRGEFRQNFLFVRGALRDSGRGFELSSLNADQWEVAGPEPKLQTKPAPRQLEKAGAGTADGA